MSSCEQALAQLPQTSHLFTSAGVSLAYSRHLNGHAAMHAAQPVHLPVFTMFSSSDFWKLGFCGLMTGLYLMWVNL